MCRQCGSTAWETQAASGRGRIYSWIVSQYPSDADGAGGKAARIVVLVELDEGVRVVANLVDADPGAVVNDAAVEVCFVTYGDVTLPQFRLVTRAGP
jgi:hypothetical protein